MEENKYVPFASEILDVLKETEIEYTFRMAFQGDVKPGQFFQVSIPKQGECPISVSGIGENSIDLTIRKVGHVTNHIFEEMKGSSLFLRGPYGNGFDVENYKGKDLVIIAGGTGVSPVRGVVEYFHQNRSQVNSLTVIAGFKGSRDILFKEDFKRWETNMNLILTIDKEEEGYQGKVGLVTKYVLGLEFDDKSNAEFIVVGPPMMMKFAVQEVKKLSVLDTQIWISHERKMCCGIGKCGHCRINSTYVCVDGPVFNYAHGKNLID